MYSISVKKVVASLLCIVVVSCDKQDSSEEKLSIDEIETHQVEKQLVSNAVEASCNVVPQKIHAIKSRVGGEISEVFFELGDQVKKGDLLAELDAGSINRELVREELAFERQVLEMELVNSRFKEATARLEVLKELNRKIASSKNTPLILANSPEALKVKESKILYEQLKIGIKETKLRIEDIKEKLTFSEIRSPASGVLISKNVEQGAIVGSGMTNISGGDKLFEISNTSELRLNCLAIEIDSLLIKKELPLDINFKVLGNKKFKGVITNVSPQLKQIGGLTRLEFYSDIDASEIQGVKPGMHATVKVYETVDHERLVIDSNAIGLEKGGKYVFLKSDREFIKKSINAKRIGENKYEVFSGLKEGEIIASYYIMAEELNKLL